MPRAAVRTLFAAALLALCACEENPIEAATEVQREVLRTSKDEVQRAIADREAAIKSSVEASTREGEAAEAPIKSGEWRGRSMKGWSGPGARKGGTQ